jgi:hypothetical protein
MPAAGRIDAGEQQVRQRLEAFATTSSQINTGQAGGEQRMKAVRSVARRSEQEAWTRKDE